MKKRKIQRKRARSYEDSGKTRIPPPLDAKVINVIFGGSDICGTSYSADKRHAEVSKTEREERTQKSMLITNNKKIIFDEHDRENI